MSDQYVFGNLSESRQSETEIRHVFKHLVITLCNQKWKIVDQMTEWSKTLVRQIQDHVNDQRKLLDEVYDQKVSYLDTIRDQCLNQALVYEQQNDIEQMNQLINQCNTLKLDVAMLIYIERPIVSIQLATEIEQLPSTNGNEYTEYVTQQQKSPTKIIENHDSTMIDGSDAYASLLPTTTIVNTEPSRASPTMTNSEIYENQSIVNNYHSEDNFTEHDILMEKCPICYMIFPSNMTMDNRNLHINEHYQDD